MVSKASLPALDERGWLYHPPFPAHWERASLYSLAKWVNGLAFRDIQFSPIGRPVIKIAEIKGGISPQTKFTEQSFDEAVRIRPGDLLFSWSGQPETSIDAFWWRGPEGWLNQHVFRVTPRSGIAPSFFYYLLRYLKPNFIAIARNKQTTGLGHVTKRDIESIEAAHPDEPEQLAIAHILGTLDDKIELNRRRNQTLEALARALFKDWFVDFGPVRAKMEARDPYLPADLWQLFPNRLDDDGKPEGWGTKRVSDFLSLAYGKSLPAGKRHPEDVPVYGSGGITGFHNEALVNGPAVIVGRKGTVGSLYWEDRPCFPIDTVFFVQPKAPLPFCYYLLDGLPLRDMNTDAAVPGLNRENVYRLEIAAPPDALIAAFSKTVSRFRETIASVSGESETLTQLRDTLLPKLISGELRIAKAEILMEAIV